MDEHSHRRDVWGDDPEEVDASETVAELEAVEPEAARRWHDHPAFVPVKAVGRFIRRSGKRIAVTVAGFAVLLAGIALLVLPRPGWALIFVGLGILATEYMWARRLLMKAKDMAQAAADKTNRRKSSARRTGPEHTFDLRWLDAPGSILIGTSSWTDKTLIKDGHFYPPDAQDRREAPAVLRVALPVRGGGLHLLLPAVGTATPSSGSSAHRRRTSRSTSRPTRC